MSRADLSRASISDTHRLDTIHENYIPTKSHGVVYTGESNTQQAMHVLTNHTLPFISVKVYVTPLNTKVAEITLMSRT